MTFRRLVIAIALLSILFMAVRPMVDTDTWWHIRTGQSIIDHRSLLVADEFSFTRSGQAYYYPAWISEVLMAKIFSLGGLPALNLFFAGLILVACVLILFSMKGDGFLTAIVLVLAAGASEVYWSIRPQLFTFLFSACFYLVIQEFLFGKKNALLLLPAILLVWVNVHPGFAAGFLLLGIALIGQGVKFLAHRHDGIPETGRKLRWLAFVFPVSLAAAAINPRGLDILRYPFQTVSIQFLQKFIQEWQSPDFHTLPALLFLALCFAAWATIAFSPKAMDIIDFLFLAIIGFMGFMAWRNTYLLSIVAPVIILRYAQPILQSALPDWNPNHPVSRVQSAVRITIIAAAASAIVFWSLSTSVASMEAALRRQIPVDAVEYLSAHPVEGRVFNSYNWGGYLLWAIPSRPVFVDGRTDLYGDEILGQYLAVYEAQDGWRDVLETWGIQAVFLEPTAPILQTLLLEGWTVAYRDSQSVILLHPDPQTQR